MIRPSLPVEPQTKENYNFIWPQTKSYSEILSDIKHIKSAQQRPPCLTIYLETLQSQLKMNTKIKRFLHSERKINKCHFLPHNLTEGVKNSPRPKADTTLSVRLSTYFWPHSVVQYISTTGHHWWMDVLSCWLVNWWMCREVRRLSKDALAQIVRKIKR